MRYYERALFPGIQWEYGNPKMQRGTGYYREPRYAPQPPCVGWVLQHEQPVGSLEDGTHAQNPFKL